MRHIQIISALLLCTLILSVGCDRNKADENVEAPFNGGLEGIEAEFLEIGSVSDTGADNEVWEDEAFPLEVRLMNKGEYTVASHDVELDIQGISPDDFTGIDFYKTNSESIEKVSEFLPDGGEEYVDFGDARYMNLVGTHYDASIKLQMTYPYETYINIPKVCYKEDIKDNTFCDVDETKQAFSSGGPIQVGIVRERYIGRGKILLEIPIRNVQKGKAKAFKNDEFENRFDQAEFIVNDPEWDCSCRGNPTVARITRPEGEPSNEEAVIRCVNENLEEGALYQKSVTLTLRYYYQDWITQDVRIREMPE